MQLRRLFRYGLVGIISNLSLFGVYLILTHFWNYPEIVSGFLFFCGIAGTYIFNRNWSFESHQSHKSGILKYFTAYIVGLFVQLGSLALMFRLLNFPHQVAQLFAVGFAAITIYCILNFWVFRQEDNP